MATHIWTPLSTQHSLWQFYSLKERADGVVAANNPEGCWHEDRQSLPWGSRATTLARVTPVTTQGHRHDFRTTDREISLSMPESLEFKSQQQEGRIILKSKS